MKKLVYIIFLVIFSLIVSCVTTSKIAWDSSKYYASNKVVEYRDGFWMSEDATIGDEPGVEKPDGSCPWKLISGKDWTGTTNELDAHRFLFNCP